MTDVGLEDALGLMDYCANSLGGKVVYLYQSGVCGFEIDFQHLENSGKVSVRYRNVELDRLEGNCV